MVELGMNVDVVRNIADQLDGQAQAIGSIMSSVDGLVRRAGYDWWGESVERFTNDWHARIKPTLQSAQDVVNTLARTARANADQQLRISGVNSGGGHLLSAIDISVTLLGGMVGAFSSELRSIGESVPKLKSVAGFLDKDVGKRFLGPAAMVIAGASLVRDELKPGGAVSDESMNDQLELEMGALSTFADLSPLTGAAMGAVMMGVSAVQNLDPKLTADVFRLANPGAEVTGVVMNDIRNGDYNPVTWGSDFVKGEAGAMYDVADQATHGVEHVGSAIFHGVESLF